MIQFEHSTYLYCLYIIPVLITMWGLNKYRQLKITKLIGDPRLVKSLTVTSPMYIQVFKYTLFLLSVTMLIVAWAKPFGMGTNTRGATAAPADVIFLVDVSKSMYVRDMAPDRISRARRMIKDIIGRLTTEQIGIVLFAGNAGTYVPLTDDHYYVNKMVDAISGDIIEKRGTSLRDALKIASLAYGMDNKNIKILCLISDGEFHDRNAFTLADSLKRSGINIFSFGFGTTTGGQVPTGYDGNSDAGEKNAQGQPIISHLQQQPLLKITGNKTENYITVNDEAKASSLFISQAKKLEYDKYSVLPKQYFSVFLLIGLALLVAELCIPDVLKTKQ